MTSPSVSRRVPQQARASQRRNAILDAAARLFAEKGYEASTLTEIAQQAQTSIGSLYQYFRDKEAVGVALGLAYGAKVADTWEATAPRLKGLQLNDFIDGVIDLVLKFHRDHPAYLALISTMPGYRHSDDDRQRLRHCISGLFAPRLSPPMPKRGEAIAEMVVQSLKSLALAIDRTDEQQAIINEYRIMLRSYLREVLSENC